MTTFTHRLAGLPRVPLGVLLLTMAVAGIGQISPSLTGTTAVGNRPGGTTAGGATGDTESGVAPGFNPLAPSDAGATSADLERIRANVTFWGDRFAADPRDFISATRLAASEIELARATGDITAYLAADSAVEGALKAYPDYPIALGYRGVVLVALHRFADARDQATAILAGMPVDPTALATLGDASLELGDMSAARGAYDQLSLLGDSAAALVRRGHLAFIEGRTADAISAARAAVQAAAAEGSTGSAMAWYHYQLGETLIATGDRTGAADAYARALAADPRSHFARWGLARIAAAEGHLDDAIAQLDEAIAIVPLPDFLARRADLFRLRAAAGDPRREADDRATVLAVARLAGAAANVYDRTLSIYLAGSGNDPVRALSLAQAEIRIRRDVYGYDALAWALLANHRPVEADDAMSTALAFGTRDAKLLYHAGMIALALGDDVRSRGLLTEALNLDSSFDPLLASNARAVLATLP